MSTGLYRIYPRSNNQYTGGKSITCWTWDHIQFSGTGYGDRPVARAIKIKHAGLNPEDWAMTQSLQGVLIPDSVKTGTKPQASSSKRLTGL